MQDELKPCPFCGRKAQIYETNPNEFGEVRYGIGCPNQECHIYYKHGIKLYKTTREAVRIWNTRKRAKMIFDNASGDTCSLANYGGMLYCSCGRILRLARNAGYMPEICPDCKRKIILPNINTQEDAIPYIATKMIDKSDYQATEDGRIIGLRGSFLKATIGESGYPVVAITIDGKKRNVVVKYLIAETFLEKPDDAKYVINLNGDVWDNRVENLMWCTAEEYGNILKEQMLQARLEELARQEEIRREQEEQDRLRLLEEQKRREQLDELIEEVMEEYELFL